jgi:hypothetical protein
VAGANFAELIKKDHPEISIENYKKYIDDFYIVNESELLEKQKDIEQLLSEKQNSFFVELKEIFGIDFSPKIYQGYLSIFNCNPRYLETKTFQVFYKKDLSHMLEVACHESLHFAFFEYLDKNFSDQIKGLDKNSGVLWEMSEIVNVIILNLPAFRKILGIEEKLFYPELKDKLLKAQNIWDSCGDMSKFIAAYLKEFGK